MKYWQKIIGITFFLIFIIVSFYVDTLARLNFIIKGRHAGYATRDMLNESIDSMQTLLLIALGVAIFLFIRLWRHKT